MFKRSDNKAWLLVLPALFMVMISAVIPLMAVVNYSVQDVFFGNHFTWVGTKWFEQVLSSEAFYASLFRSLGFSFIVLALEVPLGIMIALSMPAKGRRASLYIVLMSIPLLTPWFVVGVIWRVLANSDVGLLGYAVGRFGFVYDIEDPVMAWVTIVLMDVWHWTSLVALLCYAGLRAIPEEYYRAARIDGASRWKIFRYIQLPKMRRVLLIAVLLRFMDSFMIHIEPFMVTRGGPGTSTTFLSLELVQTGLVQFDLGEAGAMSIIYFLIILLLSWSLYKAMLGRESA